jgi:hypothetical protein
MRAKLAELTAKTRRDSIAGEVASAVVTRDTVRLTQWITKRDTLRTTLTLTDTVRVAQFIAVQDSTIHACREAVGSLTTLCQRKDTLIADLRAQLAVHVSAPPKASLSQRVLWGHRRTRRRRRRWPSRALVGGAVVHEQDQESQRHVDRGPSEGRHWSAVARPRIHAGHCAMRCSNHPGTGPSFGRRSTITRDGRYMNHTSAVP